MQREEATEKWWCFDCADYTEPDHEGDCGRCGGKMAAPGRGPQDSVASLKTFMEGAR